VAIRTDAGAANTVTASATDSRATRFPRSLPFFLTG
jgi:hypothetical protein